MKIIKNLFRKLFEKETIPLTQFKFMKHTGKMKHTGTKLVVIFMQIPEDPEYALVVETDSLPSHSHQELMQIIESNEGQNELNLHNILFRKGSTNGMGSILENLHYHRYLHKQKIDDIIMTPTTSDSIPLRELLNLINKNNKPIEPKKEIYQVKENVLNNEKSDKLSFAKNLLNEAKMLEEDSKILLNDSERKKKQAYDILPELNPEYQIPKNEFKSKVKKDKKMDENIIE